MGQHASGIFNLAWTELSKQIRSGISKLIKQPKQNIQIQRNDILVYSKRLFHWGITLKLVIVICFDSVIIPGKFNTLNFFDLCYKLLGKVSIYYYCGK